VNTTNKRLAIALVAVAVWVAITMGAGLLQVAPGTSLDKFASEQLVWGPPAAAAFMLLVAWVMGWRDLGFNRVRPAGSWRLLWLPMLLVCGFIAFAILMDRPVPASVVLTEAAIVKSASATRSDPFTLIEKVLPTATVPL